EDLSDVYKQLRDLRDEVRRLRAPIDLENSAIENGRMRFIGGLLRVDSGGRVEIVGTLAVEGTSQFVGPVTISGPWTFSGNGNITGDVDLTGDFEVLGGGRIKVGNVVLTPGNGGRITIGTGSSQIVIDPSQLKVGPAFKMDPAHSSDGAQQEFGLNGRATLFGSNTLLSLILKNAGDAVIAGINLQPNVGPIGTGPGVSVGGLMHLNDQPGPPPVGVSGRYMILGDNGIVYTGSVGGGGGGDTPPNPYPGGYVWPADPALYGISDNFAAHVARGSAEPGTDVMTPVGSAVYAPADGEVVAVNTSPSGATGRLIVFRASNGAWFRLLHLSSVLVTS